MEILVIGLMMAFIVAYYTYTGVTWKLAQYGGNGKNTLSVGRILFTLVSMWLLPLLSQFSIELAEVYGNADIMAITNTMYFVTIIVAISGTAIFCLMLLYTILLYFGIEIFSKKKEEGD